MPKEQIRSEILSGVRGLELARNFKVGIEASYFCLVLFYFPLVFCSQLWSERLKQNFLRRRQNPPEIPRPGIPSIREQTPALPPDQASLPGRWQCGEASKLLSWAASVQPGPPEGRIGFFTALSAQAHLNEQLSVGGRSLKGRAFNFHQGQNHRGQRTLSFLQVSFIDMLST